MLSTSNFESTFSCGAALMIFISTEPNTCLHSHALPDDETADLRFSSVDKIPILFWGEECGPQSVSAFALFWGRAQAGLG